MVKFVAIGLRWVNGSMATRASNSNRHEDEMWKLADIVQIILGILLVYKYRF